MLGNHTMHFQVRFALHHHMSSGGSCTSCLASKDQRLAINPLKKCKSWKSGPLVVEWLISLQSWRTCCPFYFWSWVSEIDEWKPSVIQDWYLPTHDWRQLFGTSGGDQRSQRTGGVSGETDPGEDRSEDRVCSLVHPHVVRFPCVEEGFRLNKTEVIINFKWNCCFRWST